MRRTLPRSRFSIHYGSRGEYVGTSHPLLQHRPEGYNLSIYDAMIAASALHADCDTLWSEDMQHGMVLDDRLRIVNPFRTAP
jgi:predicted nucleic acid-binding protein